MRGNGGINYELRLALRIRQPAEKEVIKNVWILLLKSKKGEQATESCLSAHGLAASRKPPYHSNIGRPRLQSSSSNSNISFTLLANTLEIFKARIVEGTYLFFSMEFMVCLDTPILFANDSCV